MLEIYFKLVTSIVWCVVVVGLVGFALAMVVPVTEWPGYWVVK